MYTSVNINLLLTYSNETKKIDLAWLDSPTPIRSRYFIIPVEKKTNYLLVDT